MFESESVDWAALRSHNLIYHCQKPEMMICGKLLAHCKKKVTALREHIGVRLCCFKIGVTTNPPLRFSAYIEKKLYMHVGHCCFKEHRHNSHAWSCCDCWILSACRLQKQSGNWWWGIPKPVEPLAAPLLFVYGSCTCWPTKTCWVVFQHTSIQYIWLHSAT